MFVAGEYSHLRSDNMVKKRYYFVISLPTEVRGYTNINEARHAAILFCKRDNLRSVRINRINGNLKGIVERENDKWLYRPDEGMNSYLNADGTLLKTQKKKLKKKE